MATYSFVLSDHKKKNGKQSIRLRVTSKDVQYHKTGFEVIEKDWDAKKERVKSSHPNSTGINEALTIQLNKAEKAFADYGKEGVVPNAAQIINRAFSSHDFFKILQEYIDQFTERQDATRDSYITLKNILTEWYGRLDIEDITVEFLKGFKRKLIADEKKHNTYTKRLSNLRTVFNQAPFKPVENPFDKFNVGTYEKSGSEPLTVEDIHLLWNYKPTSKSERLARDTFLFSYYAAGMRSSDVLLLEWDEIGPRHIVYSQAKKEHLGGAKLRIPTNSYLDAILKGYDRNTETVFNAVPALRKDNYPIVKKEIESRQATINRYLKLIAQKVGITKHIMFKLARTTFADIANKKSQRDVYGIQQALGHTKISTTEIYLGNDQTAIDELLKKVYK